MPQIASRPWLTGMFLAVGLFVAGAPPAARAAEADGEATAAEADARARQAAEALQSLYGQDVERVRGTTDAADDVALAKRLLAAAREATGTPALLDVLCDKAYELASAHPEGYPTAVEAATFLAAQIPEQAAEGAERVAKVRQKQYAAAEGEAKTAAGEGYIDALLAEADAHLDADAYPQVVAAARKALGIARAIRSPSLPVVEAREKRAQFLLRTRRDIENMKGLIESNPENTAAREKLVRLYLVHLDHPAAAADHLEGAEDEDLLKYVPAVGKGVEAAPELACVELGDWYRSLGESAPEPAKRAMFERAKAYYDRFLSLHEMEDLKRTTATLALKKVEDLLAGLAPEQRTATASAGGGGEATADGETETAKVPESGVIKPGKWVDLLPLVDPEKDTVKGTWKRGAGALASVEKVKHARIEIPLVIDGSYRLRGEFMRTSGKESIYWHVPAGPSAVGVEFSFMNGNRDGLSEVNGKNPGAFPADVPWVVKPSHIKNDQPYRLEVTVRRQGEDAAVEVRLNGERHLTWSGSPSDLSVYGRWRLGHKGVLGLGAWESQVVFRNLRLLILDGEACMLRSE